MVKKLEFLTVITVFVLKSLYSTIPPIMANVAPVVTRKINFLNYPMDFGVHLNGKRLLGDNKTYRGMFFGILFSVLTMTFQYLLWRATGWNLTIYDYNEVNFLALGFLMGSGVILGDAFKSVIKRQMNIAPGDSFIPWDQIDCVLGGLVFGRIVWKFPLSYGIFIIVATFFLHIIFRQVGSLFGICEKW